MPILEVKHLSKSFADGKEKLQALKNVSFSIDKGEIFGVIGASGAGKSTLIRCLNLLERPDSGQIIYNGTDLEKLSEAELRSSRKKIGMIFQGFNLLSQENVARNVAFPLLISGVKKADINRRVNELLQLVGLTDKAKRFSRELSGGQKQRVAIARALSNHPDVLLCDEPTSALDPATTQEILGLIKDINQRLNISVIIITHQMEVIEAVADRVAIIDQGELVEEGPVQDIFLAPKSVAAQRIILKPERTALPRGKTYWRLVFRGEMLNEPLIAALARDLQVSPNIYAADVRTLHDGAYGEMILTFAPSDNKEKIAEYLRMRSIHFQKEVRDGSTNA